MEGAEDVVLLAEADAELAAAQEGLAELKLERQRTMLCVMQ